MLKFNDLKEIWTCNDANYIVHKNWYKSLQKIILGDDSKSVYDDYFFHYNILSSPSIKEYSEKHKIRYAVSRFVHYRCYEIFYLINCFYVIDNIISNIKNKTHVMHYNKFLPGIFYEHDDLIFYCCFNELVKFVEQEMYSGKIIPNIGIDSYNSSICEKEILELYYWYKKVEHEEVEHDTIIAEHIKTVKLFDLLKVRNYLWT